MARRKTYTYDDLANMSIQELKKVKKRLRDSTTRKIRTFARKGIVQTPAIHGLAERVAKGKIANIKGLKLSKAQSKQLRKSQKIRESYKARETVAAQRRRLIEEALDYQTFNQKQTSTVTGFKQYEDAVSQRLGEGYDRLSDKQKSKFWKIYEEFRAQIEDFLKDDSERIQQMLSAILDARKAKRITKNDRAAFEEFLNNLQESKAKYESAEFGELPPGW